MKTTAGRMGMMAALMTLAAAVGQTSCSSQVPATNTVSLNRHAPEGWGLRGRDAAHYRVDTDAGEARRGISSTTLLSTQATAEQFALLAQKVDAMPYRKARVRFSGYLKTLEVEQRAFLWLRVDSQDAIAVSFDDMHLTPINGTTRWHVYEVLLDVPEHATVIRMGAGLIGPGQIWFNDAHLEIVDTKFASTDRGLTPIPAGEDVEDVEDLFWVGALDLSDMAPSARP